MTRKLPLIVVIAGFMLLMTTMYLESEPTLVPLLIIAAGATWHFTGRRRARRKHNAGGATEAG
jgi:hypothetical protein